LKHIVIFGGTGFIGTHMVQHLLKKSDLEELVVVDMKPLRAYSAAMQAAIDSGKVRFIQHDVRTPVPSGLLPKADLIFNFAAVHREPGHNLHEYYETNILGATNICTYADAAGCPHIVFTSSISTYGPSEESRDESSLPLPETPYGNSKLVAEKMHMTWQAAMPGRKLLVLRPGVVFGPGEGGNVTRLVRSIVKGYFVYTGNKETRKAGGYIKELCNVFLFGIDYQINGGEAVTLLNFSMQPPPALHQYVDAIRKVCGIRRTPLSISHKLLLTLSYLVEGVAGLFGIKQPISPTRVRKLYRSTNIEARGLRELGYSYQYTLEGAFADWRQDKPEDFLPHVPSHLASGQFLCPLCCAHHSLDEGYAQSAFF
jgi:nucleoside-diphosphate-sugar epimerase